MKAARDLTEQSVKTFVGTSHRRGRFRSRQLKHLSFNDEVLEGIGKEMSLMYFLYKSTHSRKGAEDSHFRR